MAESAQQSTLFGAEMLFKINEGLIKTKYDVIICFSHWVLTRYGFQCGGVGDDISYPNASELTELMPNGWNTEAPYKLRYVFKNQVYILSGLRDDDDLVINLSRPADTRTFVTTININEIKSINGSVTEMIPAYEDVRTRINKELIQPMTEIEVAKEVHTQTTQAAERPPPRVPRSLHDFDMPSPPLMQTYPSRNPGTGVGVGADDLLPPFLPPRAGGIGIGGGGGMLFNPPGMGPRGSFVDPSLPRGAVPPGARFDPINPVNPHGPRQPPTRFNHPDHDHLPPPGYDDMFM